MLLIIGMDLISVTCCDSIYVMFFVLWTCNIYRVLIVSSFSSTRGIIFFDEPTLRGKDRVLYNGAKMISNMTKYLSNAMK